MVMRLIKIAVLASVCVLPGLAAAQSQAPDPRALGLTEALLDYCSKADPSGAGKYQAQAKLLARGASDEALAKVRSSDEYQKAHDSVDDFVSKVDPHNAQRACSESLAANK
jgi:hypothetical protein